MKLNILREAHEPMKGQHKNYFLFWFLIHNFSIFHEVAVINNNICVESWWHEFHWGNARLIRIVTICICWKLSYFGVSGWMWTHKTKTYFNLFIMCVIFQNHPTLSTSTATWECIELWFGHTFKCWNECYCDLT
jgi:hypothetical protein